MGKGIRIILRLEGLALGLISVWLYKVLAPSAGITHKWWVFLALILVPDLSMLGYLGGPRIGAVAYNVVHTWAVPVLLFAIGWWGGVPLLLPLAFILGAHIGFDRALGFGLKLPTAFRDTHLGGIGRDTRSG
jgi:hypothetical protein